MITAEHKAEVASLVAQFETETCGRCGGSGHYSYCERYGTTCFKCAGRGKLYTKRGRAAHDYLLELRSKPARELQPGDQIRENSVTMGGQLYTAWWRVESAEPMTLENADCWNIGKNGEKLIPANHVKITCSRPSDTLTTSKPADELVRVRCTDPTAELDTLRQALAYQAKLTKTGTMRKGAQ